MHLNAGWHIFSPQIINDFFMSFSSHLQSDRWWLWGPKLDNFDADEILWLHSGQWEHLTLYRATGRDIASILCSYKAVTRYKTSSIGENIWEMYSFYTTGLSWSQFGCVTPSSNNKGPIKSDVRCILNPVRVRSEQHI